MAQRIGGKYSPGAGQNAPTPEAARKPATDPRPAFLALAALPFGFTAFLQPPGGLALDLTALALMLAAAALTRAGIVAQHGYDALRSARRPAIPRKIFASVLTGLGLGFGAATSGDGLIAPVILAILGVGLHLAAFGPDPLTDKGMEGVDTFQQDRVARVVDEAERHLTTMREVIARGRDRDLLTRVEAFQATARKMIRTVEEDPRDLTAARKYLGVYLMGARDASIKYADLVAKRPDPDKRADYEALLADLETNFAALTERLLSDDRSDLDVEIEVLRDRLGRDGLRRPTNGDAT